MVSLFNRTVKNIFSNYIPHETIISDDKDPSWFNNNIKHLIQERKNTYKSHILNDKNLQIFARVKSLQNDLKYSIEEVFVFLGPRPYLSALGPITFLSAVFHLF